MKNMEDMGLMRTIKHTTTTSGSCMPTSTPSSTVKLVSNTPTNPHLVPAGLEAIYRTCRLHYPDQPNPLQVTAVLKYWLGGPDPLDYISMYAKAGDKENGVPHHWHYITCGLSDLHGDGRVHQSTGVDSPSGFGFEMTFRLRREPEETAPPTWPAALLQALAKYVFQSENLLCAGDHVSWHCSLDNSESRIQHMLMCADPQLGSIQSPHGSVTFVQVIGVCAEELQAAQHWNGPGVIDLMKSVPGAGGPWLVTDMRRGESIFELDPQVQEAVDLGIELEGSNLSGVSARCAWTETNFANFDDSDRRSIDCGRVPRISAVESAEIKAVLTKGLLNTKPVLPPIANKGGLSTCSLDRKESYDSNASSDTGTFELLRARTLDSVHVSLNLEAGCLLPLALRGRLKHGRHFTFKSIVGDVAITLVAPTVVGTFANLEHPFAVHGPWLQILLDEQAVAQMMTDFKILSHPDELTLPKTFSWPDKKLAITIVPDDF